MNRINKIFLTVAIALLLVSIPAVNASAKTVKINLKQGKSNVIKVTSMKRLKKIVAKSNKKSVATVKKISNKKIKISARKPGKAKITIKIYKNRKKYQKLVYHVTVKSASKDNARITQKKSHRKQTKTTPAPTKRPRPTRDPAPTATPKKTPIPVTTETLMPTMEPTPEPTPYQAKYSYEVSVLNQFEIYENVPIVLYVKTDNPNPNDFDNVYVDIDSSGGGVDWNYEDIQYLEQEETNSTFFNKVNGGWICTCFADEPGIQTIAIQELEKGENNNNTWRTVDTFEIEVKDGQKAKTAFCEKVIQAVSADEWEPRWNWVENEKYTYGKGISWDALSDQQKMQRCTIYIKENMNYPRVSGVSTYGNIKAMIIQENVGADWDTGFTDCEGAAKLLLEMAKILGVEAYTNVTGSYSDIHVNVKAIIDGEEYYYDATPLQGGYKDWDYIL